MKQKYPHFTVEYLGSNTTHGLTRVYFFVSPETALVTDLLQAVDSVNKDTLVLEVISPTSKGLLLKASVGPGETNNEALNRAIKSLESALQSDDSV